MGRVAPIPLAAVGLLTPAPHALPTTLIKQICASPARYVIVRLLDLSHISRWTCVADQLADHKRSVHAVPW